MTDEQWGEFIRWAQVIAPRADLEREEHEYKRTTARRLSQARQQLLDGDPGWTTTLVRSLQGTNLLDWRTVGQLATVAKEGPDRLAESLLVMWDGEPTEDSIDAFEEAIRSVLEITPGNVVGLGSLLLMARDPERFPPYRPTPVEKWRRLLGSAASPSRPADRYRELLVLCDEFLTRGGGRLPIRTRLEGQGLAWTVIKGPVGELGLEVQERQAFMAWRGDKVPVQQFDRGTGPAPEMETAAWLVLGAGLRGEPSPFAGDPTVWTITAATDLHERISHDPGVGGFLDKVAVQLRDAADETVLLAAELVFLQCAPVADLKPETKTARVQAVLDMMTSRPTLPDDLAAGLANSRGFGGGQGWHAQIARHVHWLSEFVQEWLDLEHDVRTAALSDPFAFAAVTSEVSPGTTTSMEQALNYLAWPGHHSPVVSSSHRRRIRDAFGDRIGGATGKAPLDVTRDLVAIRQVHEAENGGTYPQWYYSPYVEEWKPTTVVSRRAWLVRPHPGDRPLVERWLSGGYVSLKGEHLGKVEAGSDQPTVQAAIDAGYQHIDYAQRSQLTDEYHAFLTMMREDDLVVTLIEGKLFVGTAVGEPGYRPDETGRLQRSVEWNRRGFSLEAVPALRGQQGTVVDVTSALEQLEQLEQHLDDEDDVELAPSQPEVPDLTPVSAVLADRLHMPVEALQEMVDVLQHRQQIVLYGPPGTGKTYVAKMLAEYLVGEDDTSRARLVQFHPSYAYEDFFEGYRPAVSEEGQAIFRLTPGPLRELASLAEQDLSTGQPFVLIIDEMNRANLAKVFGELYFLLEYRGEAVRPQYSDKPFRLPPNLFVIGTMNTADRSIAMVDAAIRRRFAFLELHPAEAPVSGVLAAYLEKKELPSDRADLLAALNREIGEGERDLQIGPSYLMRATAATEQGLARIWRYDILPLLEEHYYGRQTRSQVHERFGFDALRRRIAPVDQASASETGEPVGE